MDFIPDNPLITSGSCIQFEASATAISHAGDSNRLFFPDLIRDAKSGIAPHPEFIAALSNQTMKHQSAVTLEKQNAAGAQIVCLEGAHLDGFAGADQRLHAGAEGGKQDGVTLLQEVIDQLPCVRLAA